MFLSIPISMISVKNQDNLVASEKGLDYASGCDGNAPKTRLAALLIFFRDVLAGRGAIAALSQNTAGGGLLTRMVTADATSLLTTHSSPY